MRNIFFMTSLILLISTAAWSGPPVDSELIGVVNNPDESIDVTINVTACEGWNGKDPIEMQAYFSGKYDNYNRFFIDVFTDRGEVVVHIEDAAREHGALSDWNCWPVGQEGPGSIQDDCDLAHRWQTDNLSLIYDMYLPGWRTYNRILDGGEAWPWFNRITQTSCENIDLVLDWAFVKRYDDALAFSVAVIDDNDPSDIRVLVEMITGLRVFPFGYNLTEVGELIYCVDCNHPRQFGSLMDTPPGLYLISIENGEGQQIQTMIGVQ